MDDGVKIAATISFPSNDGDAGAGPVPRRPGMTPYGRNGLCGCPAPDVLRRAGSSAPSPTCAAPAAAAATSTATTSRRARRATARPRRVPRHAAVVDRQGRHGRRLVRRDHAVPHGRAAAAAPRGDHAAVAISDLYRDGFAHGGIPNLFFDAQYIGVQGGPGAAGAEHRPGAAAGRRSRPRPASRRPGTIAFDYLERPNDDAFYRDRSPIYTRDRIKVPVLDSASGATACCAARPRCTRRCAAPRRRDAAVHGSVHPQGLRRAVRAADRPARPQDTRRSSSSSSTSTCAARKTPERPPVEYYVQGATAYATPTAGRRRGTSYERLALGDGTLGAADAAAGASASLCHEPGRGLQPGVQPVRHRRRDAVRADRPAPRGPARSDLPHRRCSSSR